jgi:hypothetical protein
VKDYIDSLARNRDRCSIADVALHNLRAGAGILRPMYVEDTDLIAALLKFPAQQDSKVAGSARYEGFHH